MRTDHPNTTGPNRAPSLPQGTRNGRHLCKQAPFCPPEGCHRPVCIVANTYGRKAA